VRELLLPIEGTFKDARAAQDAIVDEARAQIRALAGAHAHDIDRLCVEIEDTVREDGRIELREMLYYLGTPTCQKHSSRPL